MTRALKPTAAAASRGERRLGASLVLLVLLATSPTSAVRAATDARSLRGELQARTYARDDAWAQADRLRGEIAALTAQLTELRAVAAGGEQGIAGKRERLQALNAQEASLRTAMGRNQADLARLLGALELFRRDPPPALLVSPGSARDAVRAQILIRAIEPDLAARAAAFRGQAEALQRVRRSITTVSEDLFTSESVLADGRASIERAIREKSALERQLDADAMDAGQKAQSLTDQLKAMGITVDQRALAAGAGPGRAPQRLGPPADGVVVRRYGQASPGGQTSDGVTWRTAPGALVRAPAAGVVEYSGALKGWGGVLILNVGGGYHLVLAGLDRMVPAAGRPVAAGQSVGGMADHGQAAPELYMELRKDGAPLNPAPWLRSPPLAPAGGRR